MFAAVPLATLILERSYSRGAEVGVWKAESSRLLAGLPTIEKLYLIDIWKPYKLSVGPVMDLEVLYQYVRKVMAPHGDRIKILRMFSVDAARVVPKDLDFVFIDASHDYESVKEDIEAWRGHIRPGGVLCGDDYQLVTIEQGPIKHRMQVDKAVDEAFGSKVHLKSGVVSTANKHYSNFTEDGTPIIGTFEHRFWYVEQGDL